MKCTALVALTLLVLIVACTSTPTPTPRVALLTATPHIETVTPTATDTPTTMPTPTHTLPATPTTTPTRTSTPTPTEIPLPQLGVTADKFIADGKEIILRGAVAPHFIQDGRRVGGLPKFKRDVEILKSWGGNFVSLVWNSGYTSDTFYVESLVSALEFARSLGFRVELVLHSRGLKTVSGGEITNQEIRIVNDQLISDWAALLGNTSATRIAKSVDIYGILSEPVNNADGGTVTWEHALPVFDKACNTIRSKIRNDNAICAYSGMNWAGDARGLLQIKLTRSNVAIEVHPYQPHWNETRFPDYVVQLKGMGYNVFVGEIGWNNDPAFVRQQVEFLKANGISFAFWAIVGGRTETDRLLIDLPNGNAIPTALGVVAQDALK